MELELSVEDLLNKRRIESDRIEFKASWNPDDIYHSVCAFANDYDNIGGYILIGVEEKNGVAVRPVKGIEEYEIPIHPDFLGLGEKVIASSEQPSVDKQKSFDSGSNETFENEKSCVSPSNETFKSEKSCVSVEKVSFEEILVRMKVKERTRDNIRLLKRAITDDIFSRSDIVKLLRISGTAAGKLINKMIENKLIIPVTGHGKGKYKFVSEEDIVE